MSKIICDICGTTYHASSECCPICGFSNAAEENNVADYSDESTLDEMDFGTPNYTVNSRKKEIFDFDEVNTDEDPEENEELVYDTEEVEDDEPRHNTIVIVLLTVLIVTLLGVAAFVFLRFFLPNMNKDEAVRETAAVQETVMIQETTEPTVPCQQMGMLSAAVAELHAEGQQFLLHVKAFPENTTDTILYTSADESIATVTEDGKITAISEGETKIFISCGKVVMDCPVIVKYVEETVPPTTEETVAETVAVSETTGENKETEATVPQNGTNLKNVTLKLKKTDIQLGVYYQFKLELDCDLSPDEVTWASEHPHIATVDEKGNVTAAKEGTTSIIAKYGDQEVQCIVRCIWY